MSNRSYVIALSEQTFMHSWHISLQTFVNSVSNKHHSWTHTRHRVQQKRCTSLDQGANWFGAPATNARRVSEANRIFNRTNPPIVAKIKDYENCTHAKFAQFSNNWQRFFFRHTFAIQVVNHWPTPIANSLREDPSSVHDIWTVTHMLASQLAALKCFHCVTKVSQV